MNRGPEFLGHIRDGKLHLDNREVFARAVERLEGKRIALTICQYRQTRSQKQNRWYWGVAVPRFAEHVGHTHAEADMMLCQRLLPRHTDTDYPTAARTSDLDTAEMSEFMEHCSQLAAELGLDLPLPSERRDDEPGDAADYRGEF